MWWSVVEHWKMWHHKIPHLWLAFRYHRLKVSNILESSSTTLWPGETTSTRWRYESCARRVGILRRLRRTLPSRVLRRNYVGVVLPIKEDACPVWSGRPVYVAKLIHLHESFCRRNQTDLPPLQKRVDFHTSVLFTTKYENTWFLYTCLLSCLYHRPPLDISPEESHILFQLWQKHQAFLVFQVYPAQQTFGTFCPCQFNLQKNTSTV